MFISDGEKTTPGWFSRLKREGLVALARTLGTQLVAEGVETASQARVVRQIGIEWIQGFHYSRPELVLEEARV